MAWRSLPPMPTPPPNPSTCSQSSGQYFSIGQECSRIVKYDKRFLEFPLQLQFFKAKGCWFFKIVWQILGLTSNPRFFVQLPSPEHPDPKLSHRLTHVSRSCSRPQHEESKMRAFHSSWSLAGLKRQEDHYFCNSPKNP